MMKIDVKAIVDKLISGTKSREVVWNYLDLKSNLHILVRDFVEFTVDTNNSFYCDIGNGHFVLVESYDWELPVLFLMSVPKIGSRDNRILNDVDEYQQDLLRLQNLVKKQHPNTEDFLNDFLQS